MAMIMMIRMIAPTMKKTGVGAVMLCTTSIHFYTTTTTFNKVNILFNVTTVV